MHCYFVLAGDASIPVIYHVERVREGKSFMTRTVQARQRGKCIFTTTASFVREGSGGAKTVDHQWGMPEGVLKELEEACSDDELDETLIREKEAMGEEGSGPFVSKRIQILNSDSKHPQTKKTRQWIRARGQITPSAGPQAHLSALAYMSDSYFIGTVSRVHNLWRFGKPTPPPSSTTIPDYKGPPGAPLFAHRPEPSSARPLASPKSDISSLGPHPMAALEAEENAKHPTAPRIGMMVSLDHTIYFHRPRELKADEWLFAEMDSPWAGDGRGLVFQKIWNKEGELLATCVQEGLVRLVQDGEGLREDQEIRQWGIEKKKDRGSKL
jgi:acyl-CoA thioesterase 8